MKLAGERVTLRPFRAQEAEAAWSERVRMGMGSRGDRQRFLDRLAHSGAWEQGFMDLAIETAGRFIGDVQARGRNAGAFPAGTYEIGIDLYDPNDRGHGFGSEALELMVGWLFEHEGAARVQGSTATDNLRMRAVFLRLGFTEEGVMRSFMPSAEGREDYVLYGITAAEWKGR